MKITLDKLFDLKNKIIILSGGAGYLGSHFAFALSKIGAIPIILDNNKKGLFQLKNNFKKKKLKGSFFLTNLDDENQVKQAVDLIIKKYKKIDCLVNVAGLTAEKMQQKNKKYFEKFEKYDFDLWKKSIEGNLSSIFIVTKTVANQMLKKKGGSIINIASDAGIISPDHRIYELDKKINYKGVPFNTPLSYSVAKSGIISMTRFLATYWAKKGIRVNCISPAGVYKNHGSKFVKKLSYKIPLGRMAKPHEFNGAIIYLCSNVSSFVTGHNLVIDGGRTIW